ncbi:MAG: glycosyltransferase family 4 protein [Clostridiales bacterium]|nr:glycosyltransferase family 4 protein [Clostridiales bacterium]
MQIIYVSTSCSQEMYKKIFKMRNKKLIDPSQKFFEQLIRGTSLLRQKFGQKIDVVSISALPVSASTTNIKKFLRVEEYVNGVRYIYPSFYNGKFLRYITTYISIFLETRKIINSEVNKEDKVVICDPLYHHVSAAARMAAKLYRVKTIAIVTDIPVYSTKMKGYKYTSLRQMFQDWYERTAMKEIVKYDGYVNLTESMNPIVNPKNKPSIIVEGSVDIEAISKTHELYSNSKKVIVYAGGVYEKYGVKCLVNAFIKAQIKDTELHIYGEGSYVDELVQVCSKHENVKYMGCILNTDLPKIESQATLLVNPRFSNEEYTKFSFPSKTLEYMSSGTPVLSTRLAGIPKDYNNYLYWFDIETEDGMAAKLSEIMGKSKNELQCFGKKAQKYVIENKSNILQAGRIFSFAKDIAKSTKRRMI